MKEKKGITKWLYWFLFAVAVIIVYKTLDNFNEIKNWINNLFNVISPFIIGILISYLFYVPSKKIEILYSKNKSKFISKRARTLAVLTVYTIALIILILVIKFILPTVAQSLLDLITNLPTYYKDAKVAVENLPEDSILNQINIKGIISNLENVKITEIINVDNISYYAKGVIGFASGIFDFVVALIVSVYILIERTEILSFISKLIKKLFKEKTNKNLGKYFGKTNEIFFKFISSQILDAVVVAILTSIAMLILNVRYAILLGIMIGIFNIIPYFGAIIAVIIAILITLFTGGINQAIWMAIIVIILQQIDANIINPKIIGNSLKLSPILVIFGVTISGAYFGILGMFLAVPIIAVLKIVLEDYINQDEHIEHEN